MRKLLLILFIILMSSSVLAIDVNSLSGELIEITNEFCFDETKGVELLGYDFYTYCEENLIEEFYFEEEQIIQGNEIADEPTLEINYDEENNWVMFLSIIGAILLLVVAVLILAHRFHRIKEEQKALNQLKPYINALKKRGFNQAQIEGLLIHKGYSHSFINKILGNK